MADTNGPSQEVAAKEKFPEAKVVSRSNGLGWATSLFWLPPLALIAAIASFIMVSGDDGRTIAVRFEQGHGLKVGDPVKHRGIEVGHVTGIDLSDNLTGVVAKIQLLDAADELAREGTRFWIERPQLGLGKMSGLDTVVGAKYIGVQPGPEGASLVSEFEGIESPLALTASEAEEVVIVTFNNGLGLQVGSQVKHRGIVVGEVM
ncbi:MAG: MlaD family protein, partial [Planctomycetota bacterium]